MCVNAANIIKAGQDVLGWTTLGCSGHTLNLAAKAALTIPLASKMVIQARGMVSYFHKSVMATKILLQKQQILLDGASQSYKLIQDVQTRWNCTHDMLQRILLLYPAVQAARRGSTT